MACKQFGKLPKKSLYFCAAFIRWSVLESNKFYGVDWSWILNQNAFFHFMGDNLLHKPVYAAEDKHQINYTNVMEFLSLLCKDLGGQTIRHMDIGYALSSLLGQFPPEQQVEIKEIYKQIIGA